MPHAASSSARARKSRRSTSVAPPASRLRMVISVSIRIGFAETAGFSENPAVALVAAPVAARHDRVGEREEAVLVAALVVQPLDVELELLVEHALQPPGGHVPLRLAVDGVADRHVVGGDGFRHRAGRAAHPEEPAHDFLARPDLRDRSVPARIEIDAERLLVRVRLLVADDELAHPSPWLLIRHGCTSLELY